MSRFNPFSAFGIHRAPRFHSQQDDEYASFHRIHQRTQLNPHYTVSPSHQHSIQEFSERADSTPAQTNNLCNNREPRDTPSSPRLFYGIWGHPTRSVNRSRLNAEQCLCDSNDLAPVSGSPILNEYMEQALNCPVIPGWSHMDGLFMYHCWDEKYGTPLVSTSEILPGDIGEFDDLGDFCVYFNVYDGERGTLPLKESKPPFDCEIEEDYIGDVSTKLLNVALASHPGHPSMYRLFLKSGTTRFMHLVRDATHKVFNNPSVVKEHVFAHSAVWYEHATAKFRRKQFDLIFIESIVEASSHTYLQSCPISTSIPDPEEPVILNLGLGDICIDAKTENAYENHHLVHETFHNNPFKGAPNTLVAYAKAVIIPRRSI